MVIIGASVEIYIVTKSVGITTPQIAQFKQSFEFACGKSLDSFQLIYETYGALNKDKSNAILICHALSGNHHAAGTHQDKDNLGWWDSMIGPGNPIDTDKFFVVCPNNIGGCFGSTGHNSIHPETNEPWGPDFPAIRVRDWVKAQKCLADYLGIDVWAAVVGASLGGMTALRWSIQYPERLKHCISIAATMKLTAQNIAFNELARTAIESDSDFCHGYYLKQNKTPTKGLGLARMLAHVSYLSEQILEKRFGRELKSGTYALGQSDPLEFQVQSYLKYQSEKFSSQFDANTYIAITRMLDLFDISRDSNNDAVAAFTKASCKFFILSFTTDWRFSIERSRELVHALSTAGRDTSYVEIDTPYSHDAFLLNIPRYHNAMSAYMDNIL